MTGAPTSRNDSAYYYRASLQTHDLPATLFHSAAGEASRDELLIRKLGAKSWKRVHHFRRDFQPGWKKGEGKALSAHALEAFFRFLEIADLPNDRRRSVFLTDRGSLVLSWEDSTNKNVEAEFSADGIRFVRESTGHEGVLAVDRLNELVAELC